MQRICVIQACLLAVAAAPRHQAGRLARTKDNGSLNNDSSADVKNGSEYFYILPDTFIIHVCPTRPLTLGLSNFNF